MQAGGGRKAYDDINITPMLDLAYVLLVIFILMATASVQGIKVDVPQASASQSLAEPQTVAIAVNAEGQIFMDAYPVTVAELEARLLSERAAKPDLKVVLKGDQVAQYGKVASVIDVLRRINIESVGLIADKTNVS